MKRSKSIDLMRQKITSHIKHDSYQKKRKGKKRKQTTTKQNKTTTPFDRSTQIFNTPPDKAGGVLLRTVAQKL